MADKKISALTGATTPLAGTEVLPIVQGGSTVKVANNDLRPKQIQSNATSGVLQVAGPATAATRVMTTPDANFTVARTDAAQSFTGDQTLGTGDLIFGTAAKGVKFANTTLLETVVASYKKSGSTTIATGAGRSDQYFSVTASKTFTITATGLGGLATIVYGSAGEACTFFWSWNTSVITILGNGGTTFVASATPSLATLGISKSATSSVLTFKTGPSFSAGNISVCLINDYASATTDPV
jgi:hypothetical protein